MPCEVSGKQITPPWCVVLVVVRMYAVFIAFRWTPAATGLQQLHAELMDFDSYVKLTEDEHVSHSFVVYTPAECSQMQKARRVVMNKTEESIRSQMGVETKITLFGSHSHGLSIPMSDLDLSVDDGTRCVFPFVTYGF